MPKPPTIDGIFGKIRKFHENSYSHREDGPAIEMDDGLKVWILNGNWLKMHEPIGNKWTYWRKNEN